MGPPLTRNLQRLKSCSSDTPNPESVAVVSVLLAMLKIPLMPLLLLDLSMSIVFAAVVVVVVLFFSVSRATTSSSTVCVDMSAVARDASMANMTVPSVQRTGCQEQTQPVGDSIRGWLVTVPPFSLKAT
jgi:hypothetical protein